MKIEGRGILLSIYVGSSDHHNGKPLYHEIVMRAREHGMAGATVLRGVEGYGASSRIHTARVLTLSEDLPVVVQIVDQQQRIDAFRPVLDELVSEGLVVREEVDIVLYRGRGVEESAE